MSHENLTYCGEVVKSHDPDRFLLSMFMPSEHRSALWVLFAFNYEIAKTREVVTETQLGLIRLQWWREAIDKIYAHEDFPSEKTIEALAEVIRKYDLPKENFETLIYAREFDLEDVAPADIPGLYNYTDFTSTPLMRLVLKVLGAEDEAEPVQQVAVNYALAGLMRSARHHWRQSRLYLPKDLTQQHNIKPSQLFALKEQAELPKVIEVVCEQILEDLTPEHKFLRLSQKMAVMTKHKLRKYGYNPLHPKALLSPAFRELRLALSAAMA
ncbi:MAG: squalene/phytoene synthase family protein [Pseudomonadota bacterium]